MALMTEEQIIEGYLKYLSQNIQEDTEYINKVKKFRLKTMITDNKAYDVSMEILCNELATVFDITKAYGREIKVPKFMKNIYIRCRDTQGDSAVPFRMRLGSIMLFSADQLHESTRSDYIAMLALLYSGKISINDVTSFNKWLVQLLELVIANSDKEKDRITLQYIAIIKEKIMEYNKPEDIATSEEMQWFVNYNGVLDVRKAKRKFKPIIKELKRLFAYGDEK